MTKMMITLAVAITRIILGMKRTSTMKSRSTMSKIGSETISKSRWDRDKRRMRAMNQMYPANLISQRRRRKIRKAGDDF